MITSFLPKTHYQRTLCQLSVALLCGLILVFSFAPYSFSFLAFVALAVFFYLISQATAKNSFLIGLFFGFGLFGYGIHWIYVSLTFLGDSPVWLAVPLTILSIIIVALFPALFAYFVTRFFTAGHIRTLLIFPSFWVIFEMLRTLLFTGFPWLFVGYSQTTSILSGYAKIGSVYLVSIIVCFIAALLVALVQLKHRYYQIIIAITIGVLFAGGYALMQQRFTYQADKPVTVLLVQGNVNQHDKWNPNKLDGILSTYYQLTKQHIQKDMLIFWPENAIPLFPYQIKPYFDQLDELVESYHASVLVGLPKLNQQTQQYYNAATVVGYGYGHYAKHILVPFGEYFPWQWLTSPFVKLMNVPMSNFTPGHIDQATLKMGHTNVASFICYESAFPNYVRRNAQEAELLAVISDDAWFGDTIGTFQHLEMTRMRSIETERYTIQATNNGITAIINTAGDVINQAPQFHKAVLTGEVKLIAGQTPWVRYGITPVFMLLALMIIINFVYKHPFARRAKKQ